MKYCLMLISFLFCCTSVNSQQTNDHSKITKTQFLVIGSTAAGIGAGIQAAKAGIKTVIIDSTAVLGYDLDKVDTTFTLGLSGLYLKELKAGKSRAEILGLWMVKAKGLKLVKGVRVTSRVKVSDGWEFNLSNGQRILAGWVFEEEKPRNIEYQPGKFILDIDIPSTTDNWSGSLYRTQVGFGRHNNMVTSYPLSRFVKTEKENWIVIPSVTKGNFSIGQIAGALAADASINTLKGINVRDVQKALLSEDLPLNSYNDVKPGDPHFLVVQRTCATGLLMSRLYTPGGVLFLPDDKVNIKEVMPAFTTYYRNSIFWFEKHPAEIMSIAEALELIYYAGNKRLDAQIQLEWNSRLQLATTFDLERPISRREFAVLTDTYLQPFDLKVDMNGMIHR